MNTRMAHRTAVTAVTLLALAAGALAAQNVDTTFTVRANPRLNVQNLSGTVVVRNWGRSEIRVQAEYDRARVEFDATPGQVSVRTVSRRGNSEVDYTINAPTGTSIQVNGLSTDVRITGVCGSVNINTVSGDVEASCIDGDGVIQSVSGDVTVADARASLEATSTSGDVDVRGARGPLTAHSVSGDVTLTDVAGSEVDVETISGSVEYSGRIADNGHYRFSAHSGDVTLRVPGNIGAVINVSTFSGDFASDFPIELVPGSRVSREWEFRLGNGSARVRLNSFSGSINLRRLAGGRNEE